MPRSLRFFAEGDPKPQGSKRHVGKGVMVESAAVKPWRYCVAWSARAAGAKVIEGPVRVELTFIHRRPKRPKYPIPATRPDVDKLSRAVFDALTGIAIEDDSRVVYLSAQKVYTDETRTVPGVEVLVEEVG